MMVTYLLRSPGTGHSIEELFGSIQREIDQQSSLQTTRIQLPYVSRGWWSVFQNLRFVRTISGTVFHITGDVHYAALALPASQTVLTIHDCNALEKNRKRPWRYAVFWLFWYYLPILRAHVVTTVSEKTRQELLRHVGRLAQKVVVVANGYDPVFAYRPARFHKAQPVLLQIGTSPNKNLPRLIAAIADLACTLVIVGPLTAELMRALQQYRIHYRNYVDLNRAEVIQLYESCDIVTFVSTYEGFGMPILEANAIGRAVITSNITPMCTIAAGSALLVDPTDTNAVRQGILRLIQDDVYRQALLEAGLRNAQRYMIAASASQYAALYREIASHLPLSEQVA
ncbi:glycosyltransferase family 4 protein [Spirosoma foliorum]|uniref:Glycosyltransferase family 4 protein n=1 Tax=Spirosoma foliorum TaxID=2710596 RepID=A0A7G5GRF5_9BACT|nr:glycosyltransferase family 1 protein [Spirosoma foliorum]QMW01447.1 glycosyltransferase family 4 protein [Spirosoma foliorum]